ncbi:leucine-rich repeat-containing protein 18 [Trichomycterus rosablanca]|uniref:leucine-rich repeat-containing protein 18 n=1 Tax=Trichomycterus rosablanca TaxID=2290929 RepID=UPI002F35F570
MAKGKRKSKESTGRKITFKMARSAVKLTVDGKRRLDLSNMEIAAFPKCILQLCDVDELDLSRNKLKKIPDSIRKFANLRLLDLHSNHLEELPQAIGSLMKLQNLNVCNNRLTTPGIPHELGLLKNLRSLNLGMNQIDTLPRVLSGLMELRQLGLFNNLLTRVPLWLQKLPNLQTVNIKENLLPSEDPVKPSEVRKVECLYLVREGCLCCECLEKCKEERGRIDQRIQSEGPGQRRCIARMVTTLSAQDDQAVRR